MDAWACLLHFVSAHETDFCQVSFLENDDTNHPLSLYAASKKADEVLAHTYHHVFNISFVFLR